MQLHASIYLPGGGKRVKYSYWRLDLIKYTEVLSWWEHQRMDIYSVGIYSVGKLVAGVGKES
jgi:hypothetical protein